MRKRCARLLPRFDAISDSRAEPEETQSSHRGRCDGLAQAQAACGPDSCASNAVTTRSRRWSISRKSWLSARALSRRSWVTAPCSISRSIWDCSRSSVSTIQDPGASGVPRSNPVRTVRTPARRRTRPPTALAARDHSRLGHGDRRRPESPPGTAVGGLLLRRPLAREVGRGPLLAFRRDLAVRDQLADRQGEVLGGGAELLVDLFDAQAGVRLDERGKLLRQDLEVCRRALGAATAPGPACAPGTGGDRRGRSATAAVATAPAAEGRFEGVEWVTLLPQAVRFPSGDAAPCPTFLRNIHGDLRCACAFDAARAVARTLRGEGSGGRQ